MLYHRIVSCGGLRIMKRVKLINDPAELVALFRAVDSDERRNVLSTLAEGWTMISTLVEKYVPVEEGGLGGEVAIIDTENTFRPERIISMAKALDLEPDEVLSKIHVGRAYNSHQQMLMVEKVSELAKERPIKMLAVDSLTGAFRAEYIGRGTLADRQGKINSHMTELARFGDLNNAAVVVTNQVSSNPAAFFGDPTKPIGGNIVGHTSKFRIYLRRGKAGKRVCRLVDSPHLPENEALVSITEDGIRDG